MFGCFLLFFLEDSLTDASAPPKYYSNLPLDNLFNDHGEFISNRGLAPMEHFEIMHPTPPTWLGRDPPLGQGWL